MTMRSTKRGRRRGSSSYGFFPVAAFLFALAVSHLATAEPPSAAFLIARGGTATVPNAPARTKSWARMIPAGYNPFGYCITEKGEQFLEYHGSLDSDLGRLLASIKERKTEKQLKQQWLEILRVSKTGQSMRIYKDLSTMLEYLLELGLID